MKRAWFLVRPLEPLVLGARPATVGRLRTLDFVPGALLLGVAAARLYGRLAQRDAWTVFHSGRVRFLDAHPLTEGGGITFPVPRIWGTWKDSPVPPSGGRLDPEQVHRLGAPAAPSRIEPLRGGWIALDGTFVRPRRTLVLKTAIDRSRGRARENALFGYEALAPGVAFLAGIEADADLPDSLFDELCGALEGEARIGRSRSAQFGTVEIRRAALLGEEGITRFPTTPRDRERLVLWLLSDLVLEPEDLGRIEGITLADLTGDPGHAFPLCAQESALAFERIGGFNGHLRRPEWTRVGLARGSVLSFAVPAELDRSELARRLAAGLGAAREIGCGRVWPDPPLLADGRPCFQAQAAPAVAVDGDAAASGAEDDEGILAWLEARASRSGLAEVAFDRADLDRVRELYRRARALAAAVPGQPVGPSRSQWGRLQELARRVELEGTSLADGFDGVSTDRAGQREWNVPVDTDGTTFAGGLRCHLGIGAEGVDQRAVARRLGLLAAEVRLYCEAWRRGEEAR